MRGVMQRSIFGAMAIAAANIGFSIPTDGPTSDWYYRPKRKPKPKSQAVQKRRAANKRARKQRKSS